MFNKRDNEPDYALLNDPASQVLNQYGDSIETVPETDSLRHQSLHINGDNGIGENPNRYKQHGFYFNADNCIACHACEAACSEKNDVPGHLAFRSVGFIEGGSYPNSQRINISMACNHCDNPVCLKGCPTRAYTKFAEYGAVLQDPDICFGCGYCTWVCPYNAPQLDPVKGQVSKCNMCVDRLEVGLKPACVAACLGNALDFGVIENIPQNRTQAKTAIPGFPDTGITHPNIRFQQLKNTQRDMKRVDNVELKYHREDIGKDSKANVYKPELDPEIEKTRQWNLRQLFGSHENAHIVFTLATQAVMGAFLLQVLGGWFNTNWGAALQAPVTQNVLLIVMILLQTFGLFKLTMHLGKPMRFYRGFNNLRWSPVSREIAGVSLFYAGLVVYSLLHFIQYLFAPEWVNTAYLQTFAAVIAFAGIAFGGFYMIKIYRIPARHFWNHWHTNASFVATMMTLGGCLLAIFLWVMDVLNRQQSVTQVGFNLSELSFILGSGVLLEIAALLSHARDTRAAHSEAALSRYEQLTTYGKSFMLRNSLLVFSLVLCVASYFMPALNLILWPVLIISMLLSNAIGRALFYVLVIPTTMPGAFFWRNKKFQQHARETGLAAMPQLGVLPDTH